jgi:hypothetical protein
MEPISTHGKWGLREYCRSYRRAYRFSYVDLWEIVAFIAIGLIVNNVALFLILIIFIGIIAHAWLIPIAVWTFRKGFRGERTTTFSDDGILVVAPNFTFQSKWSEYSTSKETREFYILRPPRPIQFQAVRKRIFASESDEARFRAMLRAHTSASLWTNPKLDDLEQSNGLE